MLRFQVLALSPFFRCCKDCAVAVILNQTELYGGLTFCVANLNQPDSGLCQTHSFVIDLLVVAAKAPLHLSQRPLVEDEF